MAYRITQQAMCDYVVQTWGAWHEDEQKAKHIANFDPLTSSIVMVEAEAIGLLTVEEHDDHLWLVKVYLLAQWRNRGIGRELVGGVLERGRVAGKPVRLRVLRVNTRARALYESLGFRVVGETPERFLMETDDNSPTTAPAP